MPAENGPNKEEKLMLEINNISKSYLRDVIAVDNISISLKDGQIMGLIGPNGAGKTTLLKCIIGLENQDNGSIRINGKSRMDDDIYYKTHLGYVAEEIQVFEKLRGIEFLNFVADAYKISKKDRIERIEKYTEYFELKDKICEYINDYSHGMKQKIMIISAILPESDILILDEPFVGLDPDSIFKLKSLIVEYRNNGKSVLISTHLLELADSFCDIFCFLNKGKKVFMGDKTVYQEKQFTSMEEYYKSVIITEETK